MSRERRTGSDTVELTTTAMGGQGDALAEWQGKRVFVPSALPGERVRTRLLPAAGGDLDVVAGGGISVSQFGDFPSLHFLDSGSSRNVVEQGTPGVGGAGAVAGESGDLGEVYGGGLDVVSADVELENAIFRNNTVTGLSVGGGGGGSSGGGGGGGGGGLAVGEDTVDWPKVFTAAKIGGLKNYFIEQSWELTVKSAAYLKALNV